MESSALFIIASILRRRAGGVMLVVNNDEEMEDGQTREAPIERLVLIGVEALKVLIRQDRASV